MVIVVSDASIRNNIAIFIVHVHFFNNFLKKTYYHVINITLIEAELFAIRYRINQMVQVPDSSCIIVIIDILNVAHKIFDSSIHPCQL